jgi:hypothetical protein
MNTKVNKPTKQTKLTSEQRERILANYLIDLIIEKHAKGLMNITQELAKMK